MGKLSKQQITEIDQQLAFPWGEVKLQCDTYEVIVQVQRKAARSYTLAVYVDGVMKGDWMLGKGEESKRFLRPVTKSLFTPREKAKILKEMGKRHGTRFISEHNRTWIFYEPHWKSVRSMLSHFCEHSESVSVIAIGLGKPKVDADSDAFVSELAPTV